MRTTRRVVGSLLAAALALACRSAESGAGKDEVPSPASEAAAEREALIERARALEEAGRVRSALQIYRALLARDPHHPLARARTIALLEESERWTDLETTYRGLTAASPTDASLHRAHGAVLQELGRTVEAYEAYTTAETLEPGTPEQALTFADVLIGFEMYEQAIEYLGGVLEVHGERHDLLSRLGWVLLSAEQPLEALDVLTRAEALAPPGSAVSGDLRVAALLRLERFEPALVILDRRLAHEPADAELHYRRGLALRGLGRPAGALAAFSRALAFDPAHPAARAALDAPQREVNGEVDG